MMQKYSLAKFAMAASILLFMSAAQAQSQLFVKVEDLMPSGEGAYNGSDIEAIELRSPDGFSAFYANKAVDFYLPENEENTDMEAGDIAGMPVLVDWDVPYVFSLNGGWVVGEIDIAPARFDESWRLTVYEVDGSLFDWGDAPEPYRVSVSESESGPWRELGVGSGTARFTLDGQTNQVLDEEILKSISEYLETKPDNLEIGDDLHAKVVPFIERLKSLEDRPQLEVELVGLKTFFGYKEHVVNDHGEKDTGTVMAGWYLLQAAWERYQHLSE